MKKKLIFYGYVTISPVLFLICFVLFLSNYHKVVEEKLVNDISGVESLAESINMFQTEVKDITTYICINEEIHKLLLSENSEELNENAKLWLEEAPMQIVQDMISLKGDIKTIAIYPENGVRPYLRGMDASAYVSDVEAVHRSEIYQETIQSDNGMIWKLVQKGAGETYETNRTNKIVLYREIFDLTQKKTLGYIAIGVDQQRVNEMCQRIIQGDKESVLILDKNGGELARAGILDKNIEKYLKTQEFMKENYKNRPVHFTYDDYEIVCNQMDNNASIICKIVPEYGRQMRILDIVYMPLILLLGLLVGLCPLLLLISNIVTKPLQKLSVAIEKFSAGDFEQQVEVTTEDEVGEVARCFNRMVDDIRTLIDENYVITLQEKESELAALQAQINPHFLYNTLDTLYWQATDAGNEEIAENILALSQLFRLLLNQGKSEVTVEQEMELISRYLQIQKIRFGKRMNYEIRMEDSIRKVKIPKLILQPFVENAIVHGFENVTVPCQLTVTGKQDGEFVKFEVKDTGIGMNQYQIDAIWEEEKEQYAKQRIGRYAIKNIRERLRLKYKDNFEMQITSNVGHGTTVILMIPFGEGEKNVN
ncbi:MAG: histidine kinase [Lachnospiraceae bacterium]